MSLLGTQALLSWWRFVVDLSPTLIEWNGDTFGMIRFPCSLKLRQSGWPRTRSARHRFLARVSLENREVRHRSKLPQKPPGETLGESAFLQQAPHADNARTPQKQQSRAITYAALCRTPSRANPCIKFSATWRRVPPPSSSRIRRSKSIRVGNSPEFVREQLDPWAFMRGGAHPFHSRAPAVNCAKLPGARLWLDSWKTRALLRKTASHFSQPALGRRSMSPFLLGA